LDKQLPDEMGRSADEVNVLLTSGSAIASEAVTFLTDAVASVGKAQNT
jgi:hypothetical protein